MFFISPLEEVPVGGSRSSNAIPNVEEVPLSRGSISASNAIDEVPIRRISNTSDSKIFNSTNDASYSRISNSIPNPKDGRLPRSINSLEDSNSTSMVDDAPLPRNFHSVPNGEDVPLPNRSSNSVDDAPLPRGGYNLDKVLEPSPTAISQESLIPCPTCGRTFLKVKLILAIIFNRAK